MSETSPKPRSPYFLDWAWEHKLLMTPIVLALLFSLCGGCVGLIYINLMQTIRQNPLHSKVVEIARENPQVAEELGAPIEGGFITEGVLEADDDNMNGTADCTIPIGGPQGTARLLVKATLSEGRWTINSLTASMGTSGQVITLVEEDNPVQADPPETEATPDAENVDAPAPTTAD
ncbi:cytochrome c oxidase assembly factor Coa1 family protein [Rubinisphaera margarita]|uniref:cytochrome c oxidase assembly factor Coa1 family protein n=1 Tax=Rubinisphaera margarita TaxID=2909586 RepID=UPI001EE7D0D4|nr:cytochrome c oxidase assembly factor Coa1 family protein [Rubinisphaera margarita]MCG6157933.1 cytochrome c oxidase assembly factor 1 family protein [Rubinisphaera margarita]